jgi:hypothetical protein
VLAVDWVGRTLPGAGEVTRTTLQQPIYQKEHDMKSRIIAITVAVAALLGVSATADASWDWKRSAPTARTATAPADSVDSIAIQNGEVTYPDLGLNSVASSRIQDGGVAWDDLAANSVSGYKVKDGTIAESDLSTGVLNKLNAEDQVGEDVKGATTLKAAYNTVTVENTGGPWLDRKTDLGSFVLPAGTWVIHSKAKFTRTVADETDPIWMTKPQFSVRAFPTASNPFGQDFGTVMGPIAPFVGADMFGSDAVRVQLTEETTFTVAIFGYQDDRGSDNSGKIKLTSATIFAAVG